MFTRKPPFVHGRVACTSTMPFPLLCDEILDSVYKIHIIFNQGHHPFVYSQALFLISMLPSHCLQVTVSMGADSIAKRHIIRTTQSSFWQEYNKECKVKQYTIAIKLNMFNTQSTATRYRMVLVSSHVEFCVMAIYQTTFSTF